MGLVLTGEGNGVGSGVHSVDPIDDDYMSVDIPPRGEVDSGWYYITPQFVCQGDK